MYDDVRLDLIPREPHAVAAYINGQYANIDEARKQFPHARILGISVGGEVPADAYDIERGDYTPEQAASLFRIAQEHGIWRPCFYAQLSGVMSAVRQSLNTVVKSRADVRLWVAYYNNQADLPAEYDAHQFTDRALGRSLDESICRSDFFPAAKPQPKRQPRPEWWEAKVGVNHQTGEWRVGSLPAE